MSPDRRRRLRAFILVAVPLSFLAYFFIYPVASILGISLFGEAGFSFSAFSAIATRSSLRGAIWFTVWQATASTIVTLVVAMPAAYVFARFSFPGKSFFRAAITVPFVLPTVVVGAAYLAMLGPNGPLGIDLRQTIWAILIAHVFYNYAVVVRTVGGLWAHLDPRLERSRPHAGRRPVENLSGSLLPLLRPAIAAATSIVFLFTSTSFGVVLILGGFGSRQSKSRFGARRRPFSIFPWQVPWRLSSSSASPRSWWRTPAIRNGAAPDSAGGNGRGGSPAPRVARSRVWCGECSASPGSTSGHRWRCWWDARCGSEMATASTPIRISAAQVPAWLLRLKRSGTRSCSPSVPPS